MLGEQMRLVEAPLAKSSGMQRHGDERVDRLQVRNRGRERLAKMRGSRPLPVVFELDNSAA
jgi:hypothetical protein